MLRGFAWAFERDAGDAMWEAMMQVAANDEGQQATPQDEATRPSSASTTSTGTSTSALRHLKSAFRKPFVVGARIVFLSSFGRVAEVEALWDEACGLGLDRDAYLLGRYTACVAAFARTDRALGVSFGIIQN